MKGSLSTVESSSVPASWKGKVIRLHFDAVNFLSEVWLNDQAVGVHEGGFTPFEFRVDKLIRARRGKHADPARGRPDLAAG